MNKFLDGLAVWSLVILALLLVVLCVIGWVFIFIEYPLVFLLLAGIGWVIWSLNRVVQRNLNVSWCTECNRD